MTISRPVCGKIVFVSRSIRALLLVLAQAVALGGCGRRGSEAQWTFTWGSYDEDTYDHDVWYETRVSCSRSKEATSFRSKSKAYICKKRCKEHGATCAEGCERNLKLIAETCQNVPSSQPPPFPMHLH